MAIASRMVLAMVFVTPTAAQEVKPKVVLTGHKGSVLDIAFSTDGKRMASTGLSDRALRFWDTATGAPLKVKLFPKRTELEEVTFTPNGKAVIVSYTYPVPRPRDPFQEAGFEAVEIINLATGAEHVILQVEDPGGLQNFRFTPDGRTLAILGSSRSEERKNTFDGRIHLWDFGAGKMKDVVTLRELTLWYDIRFSPDGSTLASLSGHDIVLVDTASWKVRARLRDPKWYPCSLDFSPNGRSLASVGGKDEIRVWDLGTGLPRTVGGLSGAGRVSYSPDGTMLLIAGGDGKLHLLDTTSYDRHVEVAIHKGGCALIEFSPGGNLIATAYSDGKIKLWETAAFARLLEARNPRASGGRAAAPRARRAKLLDGKPLNAVKSKGDIAIAPGGLGTPEEPTRGGHSVHPCLFVRALSQQHNYTAEIGVKAEIGVSSYFGTRRLGKMN